MLQAVLFDWDDTLSYTEPQHLNVLGVRAAGLDCLRIDHWNPHQEVDCVSVTNLDEVLCLVAERRYG
ncbi:MAG: hypothetical protein ACR2PL_07660 [Dehalococcoidia bacterium]